MATDREAQKAEFKIILETLQYDSNDGEGLVNIKVSDTFINAATKWPYFFIVDGDTANTIVSTASRNEVKKYQVKAVFKFNPDEPYIQSGKVNDIEELVKNELIKRSNIQEKDGSGNPIWDELIFGVVETPFKDSGFIGIDNQIFLTFNIETRVKIIYQYV